MVRSRHCAYLTMAEPDGFEVDIELAFPPLEARGWQFEAVSWRSSVQWSRYDAVYIGAAWDYPQDPGRFLSVLDSIVESGTLLINDISLVRWTIAKTYLRDLEQHGIRIVPSLWFDDFDADALDAAFDCLDGDSIIIKPVISTNALDTHLLTRDTASAMTDELSQTFADRPYVVQQYVSGIQEAGEYSLFFFAGEYNHTVRKMPAESDFRVQEQFGSTIVDCEPGAELLAAAKKVIEQVEPQPVYARVDMVCGDDGQPMLMELELIEPSMYLRKSPAAPAQFASAFERYYNEKTGGAVE